MAEKGEVVDTVSLPPTYAPSEAYTESPPPAYKRAKSTTMQVTRTVCITVLALAFMIGFFIVTSRYISAKNCDCHSSHKHENLHTASILPQVGKLVGGEGLNQVNEMNGNGIDFQEEPAISKDLQQDLEEPAVTGEQELNDNIPEEEVEALIEEVADLEEVERELEEEIGVQDIMQQEIEAMKKKIKLPIDMILGNPSLAGRDVNCEVERRQQPIGGGIVSQAIIVTCSDDDDNLNNGGPKIVVSKPGPGPFGPPLSLLAPIMKMLSAKARARASRPIEIKAMPMPPPFPVQSGPRPCSPDSPFPCFMNQPKSLGPFPGPINGPINGPIPMPFNGPMPGPLNGPFPGPKGPFPAPFNRPSPPQISRNIQIPINAPIPNDLPNPFQGPPPFNPNGPFPSSPKSFTPGPIAPENQFDNEPRNRMLPIALRPLVRVSPRMPRILALATKPERQGPQTLISSLQRGANKVPRREPRIIPTFPEAQPRAIQSPVTIPGLRLLPARILNGKPFIGGIRLPNEVRPITHMEMRKPEEKLVEDFKPKFPDFGPPRIHTVINNKPNALNQPPQHFPPRNLQLSPAQIVSKIIEVNSKPVPGDIMTPPKPIAVIHKQEPIAGPPPHFPIFPPPPPPPPPPSHSTIKLPPPPKMDPEGRIGNFHEVEPDAEIIVHPEHPPTPGPIFSDLQEPPRHITKEIQERPPQNPAEDRKHHLLIVN